MNRTKASTKDNASAPQSLQALQSGINCLSLDQAIEAVRLAKLKLDDLREVQASAVASLALANQDAEEERIRKISSPWNNSSEAPAARDCEKYQNEKSAEGKELRDQKDLFNTLIKDLTEELSLDDNIDDSDVLEEKKKVLEEDSAKNIPQNEMKISFPQVKLEIFFHDILEGPKLEINGIRENENRVLNNEKYGSQGILESLNREDGENENSVDCSSEKGCMYVQYTLSSKFSNTATIENNERNKIKSICKVDNNMKEVKWDDNDALCIVAVSGPESLVPGTPLYTYAEEPYELFEYTEQPRCLPGRSPSPPLHPLAGNTSSFSTFAKNDLHGYMRLPLPMHSGWFVVSYVRTYIAGIEESKTSDDNEKEERNENEKILVNTNITEETVKNNIPSIIIRKRIELGKSELFSIEVPVQGVGEDVLLPCNKGVRRRGAGYLGGPLWEGTVDSGFFDKQTFKDDKKNNNNDSKNDKSNDITECNYNADFNVLFDNGIQDPRSLQSKHSIPLGKTVEMLDVTVEDLKSIKTLSLTISLPHIEQNKKFPNFDDNNESIDRSKNKNEDRNKNKYFVDRKFVKDDVCVDIDSQKSTESILCRAMIWAYDVNKEKEKEKIRFDSGKKIEKETHKNNNFHKSSYDINIAVNDHKINYNSNNNNCNNYDDLNDNNDDNDNNDGDKIKQRTVLRIVVEADVITIHRNNGVVTAESVRTAYGILNINDDDDVIQSILNNSKFDHMNNNMPYPSSKKSRIIPLKLTGSTGSINRYGQFISRIFYGENSGGNLRLKDTVSPYSKREEILLPSSPKTVDQVKSNITDFMIISSTEINVEEKEENLNDDKKRNINKNTDINETTDTDINIDICCGFCDNRLVPLGAINKNLPMPTGEFDDMMFDFICCEDSPLNALTSSDLSAVPHTVLIGPLAAVINPSNIQPSSLSFNCKLTSSLLDIYFSGQTQMINVQYGQDSAGTYTPSVSTAGRPGLPDVINVETCTIICTRCGSYLGDGQLKEDDHTNISNAHTGSESNPMTSTSTSTSPSSFPSSLSTDNIADRDKDKVNHNDEDKDVIDATSSILPIIAATSPPTTSTTTTTTASPTSPTTAPSSALPSLPTFLLNDVKDIRLALNSVKIQRTFLRPKNFPPQIPTFLNISYEQALTRLMLRLNAVNGISSFALFLSDGDNEENSLLSGISYPKSITSSNRDFILLRILNKDYKILFSMNGNIIEKLKEAIKVSHFICINDNDNQSNDKNNNKKRSNNSAQKEIKNSDSNTSNKNNLSNKIELSGEVASNFNKLEEKKQISKSKKRSFARIPVQFHEFKKIINLLKSRGSILGPSPFNGETLSAMMK